MEVIIEKKKICTETSGALNPLNYICICFDEVVIAAQFSWGISHAEHMSPKNGRMIFHLHLRTRGYVDQQSFGRT